MILLKYNKDNNRDIRALMDLSSEINIIYPIYNIKLASIIIKSILVCKKLTNSI